MRDRRQFTDGFKASAVRQVLDDGKTIAQAARDLDLVASVLLTGQVPEVLEAVELVPVGQQDGLRTVALRGQVSIDPSREDFFRRLVEERQVARRRPDLPRLRRDRSQRRHPGRAWVRPVHRRGRRQAVVPQPHPPRS